jgi:hypothetical protein
MSGNFVIFGIDRRGWLYELGRTDTAEAALRMRDAARSTWASCEVHGVDGKLTLSKLEELAGL